ncbi:MAG: helix-turn-helix domain-containing protein [Vicinamibacterales bacterium]
MHVSPEGLRRLAAARDLLCDGSCHGLTVDAVAAAVGMSPFHFIRRFDAVFGATPHQYRVRTRLQRAKDGLAAGGTVTDVCLDVGFSSLGSFSSLFSRAFGESPSAYRRRARAVVAVPGRPPAARHPGCLSLMAALPAWPQFSRSAPAPSNGTVRPGGTRHRWPCESR